MFDFLIALTTIVPMDVIDWADTKLTSLKKLLQTAVGIAAAIAFAVVVVKSGFSIGRIIVSGLVAGLIVFIVALSGLEDVANLWIDFFGK